MAVRKFNFVLKKKCPYLSCIRIHNLLYDWNTTALYVFRWVWILRVYHCWQCSAHFVPNARNIQRKCDIYFACMRRKRKSNFQTNSCIWLWILIKLKLTPCACRVCAPIDLICTTEKKDVLCQLRMMNNISLIFWLTMLIMDSVEKFKIDNNGSPNICSKSRFSSSSSFRLFY